MKKVLAALAAATMAFSLLACGGKTSTSSTNLLDEIKERGEIVIATEGDWSPWTYHNEANELVGFDVEIGTHIAEKLGVSVRFEETDWDSILAGTESGRFDIACNGVGYTEERAKSYNMSEPYAYSNTVLVVRDSEDRIQTFEDLKGMKTANTASSTFAAMAESYGAEVTPVNTIQETIELLLNGRIDATLNAKDSIADYLSQHPDAPIRIVDEVPGEILCIPVTKAKDSESLVQEINAIIAEMQADGSLAALSEKYFGEDLTKRAE